MSIYAYPVTNGKEQEFVIMGSGENEVRLNLEEAQLVLKCLGEWCSSQVEDKQQQFHGEGLA